MPVVDVLVRRAKAQAVETVMIGGRLVYAKGRFTRVDRDDVLSALAAALDRPDTAEEEQRRRLATALLGPVRDFYRDWPSA